MVSYSRWLNTKRHIRHNTNKVKYTISHKTLYIIHLLKTTIDQFHKDMTTCMHMLPSYRSRDFQYLLTAPTKFEKNLLALKINIFSSDKNQHNNNRRSYRTLIENKAIMATPPIVKEVQNNNVS